MRHIGKMKLYSSLELKDSRVSIGFECLDRDLFNPVKCYDLLGKSGIKYARCQTGWAKCEKEKGIYDFTWLDEIVDNLLIRGVTPWFNVGYGNPIYMDNITNETAVGCSPTLYGEETFNAWINYVKALAEHFKGRIQYYEIWNEPNASNFWYPEKPDGGEYAGLVKTTGAVIRKIIPEAKIGGNVSEIFDMGFVEKFVKNIKSGDIDFFCFHAYGKWPEQNYPENIFLLKKLFEVHGIENVKIWQGECGFPSWAADTHWLNLKRNGNEHQQAVWQLRRYFIDIYAGVEVDSFFMIADMMEGEYVNGNGVREKAYPHWGILNGKVYTPKKSYETLSRLAAFFGKDVYQGDFYVTGYYADKMKSAAAVVYMSFKKDEQPIYAYWNPVYIEDFNDEKDDFYLQISEFKSEKVSDYVLIDMYNGDVFEIEDDQINKRGCQLTIKDIPITGYPLVICKKGTFKIE